MRGIGERARHLIVDRGSYGLIIIRSGGRNWPGEGSGIYLKSVRVVPGGRDLHLVSADQGGGRTVTAASRRRFCRRLGRRSPRKMPPRESRGPRKTPVWVRIRLEPTCRRTGDALHLVEWRLPS